MRKDLKIGMAIGAVLLVVLIVYLAVPKTDSNDLAQNTGAEQSSVDGDAAQPGADSEQPAAPVESAAAPESPVATGEQSAEQPGSDVFSADSSSAESTGAAESTAAGKGTNWDLLLATGEVPSKTVTPSLRASNVVAPAAPATGSESPATPTVTTDSDGTPTGTTGGGTATTTEETPAGPGERVIADPPTPGSETSSSDTGAADSTETTTTTGGARTHKVKPGETFSSIAKLVYKDERKYLAIEAANPTVDSRRLRPGTTITLPDLDAAQTASAKVSGTAGAGGASAAETARTAAASFDPKTEYKVKRGDSLYKIAVEVYGSSNMVDDLYEANKQSIGADSSKLKLGQVLKLPPNPNAQASSR